MTKKKTNILRKAAESLFEQELSLLQKQDKRPKPENWKLSPAAVLDYIMGKDDENLKIEAKYIGPRRVIEIAIATLISDRALLFSGIPGTAKTWLSEHLAAAISGSSHLLIQGSSAVTENDLRYSWNYALLLKEGPTEAALIPGPVMRAMQEGKIIRIEELSRIAPETQDVLLSILSEKTMHIPELNQQIRATKGFNLIATSNEKDKGTFSSSSALQRRFNTVHLEVPGSKAEEVKIVLHRLQQLKAQKVLSTATVEAKQVASMVRIFRELRSGKTEDGTQKLKIPNATLSTAEIISTFQQYLYLKECFDTNEEQRYFASSIISTVAKEADDFPVFKEYLETVLKKDPSQQLLYKAFKDEMNE